jgi:thymidylate kinase
MGFEVILTKEPTADPEVGREVRKILNKEIKLEPREISFFFPKR